MAGAKRGGLGRVVGLGLPSLLLMGFAGGVYDFNGCRYVTTSSRTAPVAFTGFVDAPTGVTICAYQQSRFPDLVAVLGCVTPSTTASGTDACGVSWYPFNMTLTPLVNGRYWARDNGPEFTKLVLARTQGGGLHIGTKDFAEGPSDDTTCWRSRMAENSAQTAITIFNGALPARLDCDGATRAYEGCPFTCNLPGGCDTSYGRTQNSFALSSHRVNSSGQATSQTRFDPYGATTASGVPAGAWTYQLESGVCTGGLFPGNKCDSAGDCTGGFCNRFYTVMRRNSYTADAINLRRGEMRRNNKVVSYVKMKYVDVNNREIGVVNRFFNADNYFAFVVREYGGDYAKIHRYQNGVYTNLVSATPSLTLTSWTQLGFELRDNGAYQDAAFVPNGTCVAKASVNGSTVLNLASTPCSFAPYGRYGVFSFYNSNAQFLNLDAVPCIWVDAASGICFE